ncbi:unnamed protein product [Paramecium pentaurelia]|uniref:Uncharacterized protein n=1 Tax=Paramecium pentaurelia TaxID=43138 RepID=A0A8S1X361_9CILI|nr:unnamed protein product [Paramecium pentaurelia]
MHQKLYLNKQDLSPIKIKNAIFLNKMQQVLNFDSSNKMSYRIQIKLQFIERKLQQKQYVKQLNISYYFIWHIGFMIAESPDLLSYLLAQDMETVTLLYFIKKEEHSNRFSCLKYNLISPSKKLIKIFHESYCICQNNLI